MKHERLIDEFVQLVRIDSESGNELNFATELKARFEALGFTMAFDDAADHVPSNSGNLYGIRKGNPAKTPVAFSCHLDTVTPGIGIQPQILDDRITSDGTTILASDDKAPIACLLEAVRQLDEAGQAVGDIEVVFSVGEEVGMHGAKHFDVSKLNAQQMFVLDSSGKPGRAIVTAPAQSKLFVKITGKAAHAGLEPEKGISAIMVMSEAIHSMTLLRIDEETTANVGIIKGGSATNIVAETCEAVFEARSLDVDKLKHQVRAMIKALEHVTERHGATLDFTQEDSYPPLRVSAESNIAKLFAKAAVSLGLEPVFASTGGGSDANIYAQKGLDVLIPAVGMTNAHSVQEYILIEDMVTVVDLIQQILLHA